MTTLDILLRWAIAVATAVMLALTVIGIRGDRRRGMRRRVIGPLGRSLAALKPSAEEVAAALASSKEPLVRAIRVEAVMEAVERGVRQAERG